MSTLDNAQILQTVAWYEADFSYRTPDGELVIEDVKGVRTAMYKLKKLWMKLQYDTDIVEVQA